MPAWRKHSYFNPIYWSSAVALVSFLLALISGLFLALWYEISPDLAYESIVYIDEHIYFGSLLLSLHHYSTHALLIASLLHLLRVFIQGSFTGFRYYWAEYAFLREKLTAENFHRGVSLAKGWYTGVILLVCGVLFLFSGYLLRYDEVGYYSVKITTSILAYTPVVGGFIKSLVLGGSEITSRTLSRFVTFHYFALPLLFSTFLLLHYYYIRKGCFYWSEVAIASFSTGVLILISLSQPFYLSARVSPELSTQLKPPWLFLWLYAIEARVPPELNFLNITLLLTLLAFITAVPVIAEKWSLKKRAMVAALLCSALLLLTLVGYLYTPVE